MIVAVDAEKFFAALDARREVRPGDNPLLYWMVHEDRVIRMLSLLIFHPSATGAVVRELLMRLDHTRWRAGVHYPATEDMAEWHAALPAGEWVEVDCRGGRAIGVGPGEEGGL